MKLVVTRLAIAATLLFFAAPSGADAQPPRPIRIGYLSGNPPSDTQNALDAFRARLRDLGYREGQDLLIENRYADGHYERLPQLAADLVRLNSPW